jgi:holo-[acyl-carrier protein] synthase
MSIRVGIDLISVASVRASVDTHAEHYLERIYTDAEVADCTSDGVIDARSLAARFAAKEATIKVLRPEHDEAVPWRHIHVRRDPSGATDLELSGHAAELAAGAGLTDLAVSLTHENDLAAAVVVAQEVSG